MKRKASILTSLVLLTLFLACGKNAEQETDSELGLTRQQSEGRRVFRLYCAACHTAYTSKGSKGPTLKGLYQKQYLPSGLIANDQFVEQSIVRGRTMMPGFGNVLTQQQITDLMAYLHTL